MVPYVSAIAPMMKSNLPLQIAEGLELNDVKGDGEILHSYYRFTEIPSKNYDQINFEDLKMVFRRDVCADKDSTDLMNAAVGLRYSFYLSDGYLIDTFLLSSKSFL